MYTFVLEFQVSLAQGGVNCLQEQLIEGKVLCGKWCHRELGLRIGSGELG